MAALIYLSNVNKNGVCCFFPTDHDFSDIALFQTVLRKAVYQSEKNELVIVGVKPTRPETGYGYIMCKEKMDEGIFSVEKFIEKPSLVRAEKIYSEPNYLWNTGIFIGRVERFFQHFKEQAGYLINYVNGAWSNRVKDLNFERLDSTHWSKIKEISFDYAIMEKILSSYVVQYEAHWSDMGDWNAIWRESRKNKNNLAKIGKVNDYGSENSLIVSDNEQNLLVTVGLQNIVVVNSADALLVSSLNEAGKIKEAITNLEIKNISQATDFKRKFRPWGYYESLIKQEGFQVKKISVKPGRRLSLQSHNHRAEHWVVVRGVATVDDGLKKKTIKANESLYIPAQQRHRLSNHTKKNLILIEVQTGNYLEEDDIVRYEDDFGR